MSLIQLTCGQEETLSRIVTALEKIADNTSEITKPTVHEEERRWRKCSQELPEDNVIVLGIVMRSDESYYYILNYRRRGSWVKSDYPQYWMPLPQFNGGREL